MTLARFRNHRVNNAPYGLWLFALESYVAALLGILLLFPVWGKVLFGFWNYLFSGGSFSPDCQNIINRVGAFAAASILETLLWIFLLLALPVALLLGSKHAWFHSVAISFATFLLATYFVSNRLLELLLGTILFVVPLFRSDVRSHVGIADVSNDQLSPRLTRIVLLYSCAAILWVYTTAQLSALAGELSARHCKAAFAG